MTTPATVRHVAGASPVSVTVIPWRDCTRLEAGGWHVDVVGNLVVPPRYRPDTATDLTGLIACLRAANQLVQWATTRRPSRSGPQPRQRPPSGPAAASNAQAPLPAQDEPAPADPATVLRAAADIAEQRWDRFGFDVYACLRAAWSDAGMGPAWVALTRPLRRQVRDGDLLGYNDCAAHRQAIAELLRRGARSLARAAA